MVSDNQTIIPIAQIIPHWISSQHIVFRTSALECTANLSRSPQPWGLSPSPLQDSFSGFGSSIQSVCLLTRVGRKQGVGAPRSSAQRPGQMLSMAGERVAVRAGNPAVVDSPTARSREHAGSNHPQPQTLEP